MYEALYRLLIYIKSLKFIFLFKLVTHPFARVDLKQFSYKPPDNYEDNKKTTKAVELFSIYFYLRVQ